MPQRRNLGGPRQEATERVVLQGPDGRPDVDAWTLNVSRGGVRLVVEDPISVGVLYQITVGEGRPRPARVVWLREEADGQIAGLKFEDVESSDPPPSFPPVPGTPGSSSV